MYEIKVKVTNPIGGVISPEDKVVRLPAIPRVGERISRVRLYDKYNARITREASLIVEQVTYDSPNSNCINLFIFLSVKAEGWDEENRELKELRESGFFDPKKGTPNEGN